MAATTSIRSRIGNRGSAIAEDPDRESNGRGTRRGTIIAGKRAGSSSGVAVIRLHLLVSVPRMVGVADNPLQIRVCWPVRFFDFRPSFQASNPNLEVLDLLEKIVDLELQDFVAQSVGLNA